MILVFVALTSLLVGWLATRVLIPLLRRRAPDIPNSRSCHSQPTPRGGGLGILAGIAAGCLLAWLLGATPGTTGLLVGATIIAACGWWDDIRALSAGRRLAVQICAAAIVLWQYGPLEHVPLPPPFDLPLGPAALPFSILWIVGTVNIYNFLDGIDGHAGLQAVVAGLAFACMGFGGSSQVLGVALAGANAGFLIHNWHPARIFMGDVGSTTIGLLLATLPFQARPEQQPLALFCMAMCLWFFLADGTLTMLQRFLRGERLWVPHRSHIYQRLVLSGVPHARVAGSVALMAACVAVVSTAAVRIESTGLCWAALALAAGEFILYVRWAGQRGNRHYGTPFKQAIGGQ